MDKLLDKQQRMEKIIEKLNNADDKSTAIVECIQDIVDINYEALAQEIVNQSERAKNDEEYRKSLKLRTLSAEEKTFYQNLVKADVKQSVTANQIDIIPTTIIDMTLADLHDASDVLSLINFGPATVNKWIVAENTGKYAWAKLDAKLTDELSGEFSVINYELGKLYVLLVLPKAIRELSLEFVDKYFMALMQMNMQDGLEYGYIQGTGVNQPIGLMKKIGDVAPSSEANNKEVISTITGFSPKQLATVRKTLTHNGKRKVTELHLICNPLDEAEYIDPALFGDTFGSGYTQKSFVPIIKHPTPNCPQGKGIFTIKGYYTMGMSSIQTNEYTEAKALDDADVLISKCYANGRATDEDVAVVFDVTKLEEYIPAVFTKDNGDLSTLLQNMNEQISTLNEKVKTLEDASGVEERQETQQETKTAKTK